MPRQEFQTIGDIEEVKEVYPRKFESKSPMSLYRMDKLSEESSISNLTDPSKVRHLTPDTHSNKLLFFTTPSGGTVQSYDMIDPYKLREIKEFVANELYRCQKKTSELYKEFERVKGVRQDMQELNQQ